MSLFAAFRNPPKEYTLVPLWFLNDDLAEEELKRQIDDFAAHGVYGFVPHPRMGLPQSIGFMSEAWLHYVKVCVDYAAKRHMIVFLYDEGMYPSGSCAGQVVAANSQFATRCMQRRNKGPLGEDEYVVAEDEQFLYVNRRSNGHIRGVHFGEDDGEPNAPASADILNPEAVATFFRLVLDRYYEVLKDHFGKTIRGVFTDEPSVLGRGHIRGVRPWTWNFEDFLQEHLGYDFRPYFTALFDEKHPDHVRYEQDFARAVNARLEQSYYAPYSRWCEAHGVALTGHPAEPDEIGFLRHFHIPGQDVVWRYVEPFQDKALEGPQSTMAKCSFSAQVNHARARNANECFGAYGWEFTEEEMWWVTNWLLVRGVNLLIPHAFYYSVRGPRREERPPDVGPNNVWWDRYKEYADYCRRLCWVLGEGKPVCEIAILGGPYRLPWRAARVLFESQRDFAYLDTDTLKRACRVDEVAVRVGSHGAPYHSYGVVIVDGPDYADADTLRQLQPLIDAGRVLAYRDPVPEVPHVAVDGASLVQLLDALLEPDVRIRPSNPHLRYAHVRHGTDHFYLFANEGREPLEGDLRVAAPGRTSWWNPRTAEQLDPVSPERISLAPYQLLLLCVRE